MLRNIRFSMGHAVASPGYAVNAHCAPLRNEFCVEHRRSNPQMSSKSCFHHVTKLIYWSADLLIYAEVLFFNLALVGKSKLYLSQHRVHAHPAALCQRTLCDHHGKQRGANGWNAETRPTQHLHQLLHWVSATDITLPLPGTWTQGKLLQWFWTTIGDKTIRSS